MAELVPSPSPIGTIPEGLVTETPRQAVQPGAIAGSYGELARGMEKLGSGVEDLTTPLAEAQAATDLQNQRVTVGPDGKVQVINPARSFIMGPAGAAYGHAVVAGTANAIETQVDQGLADIYRNNIGQPEKQQAAQQAFLAGLKGATGNPLVDQMVSQRANDAASRSYISNLDFTTKLNLENQRSGLTASITGLQEDIASMARKGMTAGNPDYDNAMAELNRKWDEKQGNPLMKDPPELVALQKKQFDLRIMGEQLEGSLPQIIDSQGMNVARTKVHEMLDNAALEPATRGRLKYEANQILAEATPKWRQDSTVFHQTTEALAKDFAAHKGSPDQLTAWGRDPNGGQAWGVKLIEALRVAHERGFEDEPVLRAMAASAPWLQSMSQLSPEQRKALTDVPVPPIGPAPAPAAPTTQPAAAAAPAVPPKSEWPKGAVDVAHTAGGAPVYVDKDGNALPDAVQPKAQPAVATTGETPPVQPAAVTTGTSEAAPVVNHGSFISSLVRIESQGKNIYSGVDKDYPGRPNSRSQGYTQIDTPTWEQFAPRAGVDLKQYPNAMSAPYDVQIKVASEIPLSRFGQRTRDMLHAQFGQFDDRETVGQIDARFGGKGTPPAGGTGGAVADGVGGFTHEQIRDNPALLWVQTLGMDKDPAEKMNYYEALLNTNNKMMELGNLPNPSQWAEIQGIHAEHAGDPVWESKYTDAASNFAAVSAEGMPAAQRAQFDRELTRAAQDLGGGDPWTRAVAVSAQNHLQALDKNWDDHTMQMAARTGMIDREPLPLNLNDPQKLIQSLVERNAVSEMVAGRRQQPPSSAFDKGGDEIKDVKTFLDNAQPQAKAAFFAAMASSLDEPVLHATMRELGGNDVEHMAQAAAGTLMKEAPNVGQSVITGMGALNNPKFDPSEQSGGGKQQFTTDLTKSFPPEIFGQVNRTAANGAYNVMAKMIQAQYAYLAANDPLHGTEYDKNRVDKAVGDVTGGLVSFNGSFALPPARGMSQVDFDNIMQGLTDADLRGAHSRGGDVVTVDMIRRSGQLEAAGDGKYNLRLPGYDPSNPTYVFAPDSNDNLFTLDLTGKVPPARTTMVPGRPDLGYVPQPSPPPAPSFGSVETTVPGL